MTAVFWLICIVMVAAAIYFVIRGAYQNPRLIASADRKQQILDIYREKFAFLEKRYAAGELDAALYARNKSDLEHALLEDLPTDVLEENTVNKQTVGALAWVLGIGIPLVGIGLYLKLGEPNAIVNPQAQAQEHGQNDSVDQMTAGLEQRLAENPNDVSGWMLLARTYLQTGQLIKGREALQRAVALNPNNPDALFQLADVSTTTQNGSFAGEPRKLIEQALAIDPTSQYGRWLLGLAKEEAGDKKGAIAIWQKLLEEGVPPTQLNMVQQRIIAAGGKVKDVQAAPAEPAEPAANAPQAASGKGPGVTVKVSLSPALKAKASPSDRLFVFAKAKSGPPMPLAAFRGTIADLPLTIYLDDSKAMMPQMLISAFPEVVVGARLSKGSQPTATSGDLQSPLSMAVKPSDAATVELVISEIVP
ncbi:MAG: c-type cytochrome biogenesis protein CcmI [Gammaproteobacteria bacterium]|nr:c-type cytochrome biogenesis protein CcmI [Gammaproteobacteria bacterium]